MDAVSYSHSAKQAQRIEKFIENPDSTSGIVTVPKVIEAGESVTVPAGRVAVLPNVQVDGELVVDGEVFIPSGSGLSTVVQKSGDTMSGNLDFASGTKITGDFNNAVNANRTAFQSTNTGNTQINVIPNNTTAGAAMHWYHGSSDIANTSRLRVGITTTNEAWINSEVTGTGVYAPIVMFTGGSERMRIGTSGNIGIGTTSPAGKLHVKNDTGTTMAIVGNATANTQVGVDTSGNGYLVSYNSPQMLVGNMNASGYLSIFSGSAERMRVDASGNVGIGTSSPARKLEVQSYGVGAAGILRISGYAGSSSTTNTSLLELSITGAGGGAVTQNLTARYNNGYEIATYFADRVSWRDNATNTQLFAIDSSGNALVTNSTGGIGYGSGAGGTVTQLTSKTTAVTLNKPSGTIFTHNAALAAGATVYFKLNNSLLSVGDGVIVTNSTYGQYLIRVGIVTTGTAYIYITNTEGSPSETIPIQFQVIKGSNT